MRSNKFVIIFEDGTFKCITPDGTEFSHPKASFDIITTKEGNIDFKIEFDQDIGMTICAYNEEAWIDLWAHLLAMKEEIN